MGAVNSTTALSAHQKEQAIIKDQLSLNNSAMKSPHSSRKHLHVSFTTKDSVRPTNDYTRLPTLPTTHPNGVSSTFASKGDFQRATQPNNYSSHSKDRTDSTLPNGTRPYVPTHLPASINRSNNNHMNIDTAHKQYRYGNSVQGLPSHKTSSSTNLSSSSGRSRARSVSPRRAERIVVQGSLSRSDVENLKSMIRSARSASTSSRK